MDGKRRAELLIIRLRWLVLIASAFMIDSDALTKTALAIMAGAFLYNLSASYIVSNKALFSKFGYIVAPATRALDLFAITLVAHWGGAGTESLYLLYGFVIVGTGYTFNRMRATLIVLGGCIILDFGALKISGDELNVITQHALAYMAATLIATYIIAFRKQDEDMRVKERKLCALFEFGTRFTSDHDLDQLLNDVLNTAIAETGAGGGYILLLDENENLKPHHIMTREEPGSENSCDLETAKSVMMNNQPDLITSGSSDASSQNQTTMHKQIICVPLVDKKNKNCTGLRDTPTCMPVGVLAVYGDQHTQEFGYEDLDLIRTLALFASMGVVNARLYNDLYENFLKTIQSLARSLEARDPYTQGHSYRVSEIAQLVAKKLGLPPEGIDVIRNAALLHDIGKIGVPDGVLQKPGELTHEERLVIQTHPAVGENICRPLNLGEDVLFLIKHHQERLNGTGYPEQLPAEQQPLPLRIICAVDALDAMSSDRPYRKALSAAERFEQLNRSAGPEFDPVIIEVLKSLLSSGELDRFYSETDDDMLKAA